MMSLVARVAAHDWHIYALCVYVRAGETIYDWMKHVFFYFN